MSERPNDGPEGPIEEPGAELPIDDEATDLEAEGALEPGESGESDEDLEGATAEAEPGAAQDEVAAKAAEADVHRERGMRPSERRAARAAERTQIPIDPSLRIKDRASSLFVLVTVVVFGLILVNALALGKGGFLTPLPTIALPTPVVTTVPTEAPSAGPTVVPSPAASPAAS